MNDELQSLGVGRNLIKNDQQQQTYYQTLKDTTSRTPPLLSTIVEHTGRSRSQMRANVSRLRGYAQEAEANLQTLNMKKQGRATGVRKKGINNRPVHVSAILSNETQQAKKVSIVSPPVSQRRSFAETHMYFLKDGFVSMIDESEKADIKTQHKVFNMRDKTDIKPSVQSPPATAMARAKEVGKLPAALSIFGKTQKIHPYINS